MILIRQVNKFINTCSGTILATSQETGLAIRKGANQTMRMRIVILKHALTREKKYLSWGRGGGWMRVALNKAQTSLLSYSKTSHLAEYSYFTVCELWLLEIDIGQVF